jgi:uncharacterized membrane protein YgcG
MKKAAIVALLVVPCLALCQDNGLLVRFQKGAIGKQITVVVDGKIEHTFAGKLTFQEANRSWQSVCGDIHSPMASGQYFTVHARKTEEVGGNIAKAGRIVARYFNEAQTPEQCAGLQIAVWEAVEIGSDHANFSAGNFQAMSDPETMSYAALYYAAAAQMGGGGQGEGGSGSSSGANFLQTGAGGAGAQGGGGQSGGGGGTGGQSQISP